jgi:hypothetical protein
MPPFRLVLVGVSFLLIWLATGPGSKIKKLKNPNPVLCATLKSWKDAKLGLLFKRAKHASCQDLGTPGARRGNLFQAQMQYVFATGQMQYVPSSFLKIRKKGVRPSFWPI